MRTLTITGDAAATALAIARGGYLPARLLSDYLDQPELTAFRIVHYRGAHKARAARVVDPLTAAVDGRRVLLVDDVSDSGDTFAVALDHLRRQDSPAELRTAVLDHKTTSPYQPDYHARVIHRWRWIIYPWAVMEDLRSLIPGLPEPDAPPAALQAQLRARHGLAVPVEVIADALRRPKR